jgi:hypothetical protein
VATINDSVAESSETFTLNLSNPVGDTILNGQGVGTIYDNDGPVALPANLVSWWTGDVDGTDRAGSNNGTLSGGVGIVPGEVANAYSFDTTNYVSANTAGVPTGNADRTLEMWVYINAFGSGETFFAGYGAFGTSNEAYLLTAKTSHRLAFSQWGQSDNGPVLLNGEWYHIAVTNVGNAWTLYLNGLAVDSGSYTISTPANTQFYIGRIPGATSDTRKLNGMVDEVSVYDRALSASEILDIFNAGSHGKAKPVPVTIDQTAGQPDPTNGSPITFDVNFGVPVYGFNSTGVSLAGSTVGGALNAQVSGSGSSYTVTVSGMDGEGTVVASIPAGAAVDAQSNSSLDFTSTDDQVWFDNIPPSVTIDQDSGQSDPTNASPITFDVQFREPVVGFDTTKVTLGGSLAGTATVQSVTAGGAPGSYTVAVDVSGSQTGTITASVEAGAVTDPAGNENPDSTSTDNTVTFDDIPPTVSATLDPAQGDPAGGLAVLFDAAFSEPVVGFDATKIDLAGTTAPGATVTVTDSGDHIHYTVTVAGMTGGGTVQVAVDRAVVADPAGNPNDPSGSASVAFVHSGTLQFSSPTYAIDEEGAPTLQVTVTRTGGSDGPLTTDYVAADGTATLGSDYGAPSGTGTLSWADGDTSSQTISVPILDDGQLDADKAFTLKLSNVSLPGALGSPNSATVAIREEAGLGFAAAAVGPFAQADGQGNLLAATVVVRRQFDGHGAVTVHYATADGTAVNRAVAGRDYATTSGTLTWADGDMADQTVTIPLLDDGKSHGLESFSVVLDTPGGNALVGPIATATITLDKAHGVVVPGVLPKGQKAPGPFKDVDGDAVTVGLGGKAAGSDLTYYLTDGVGPIEEIDLSHTDPMKSTVTVRVKKAKAGGDGRVGIGTVVDDGTGLKGFTAKTGDLFGAGILLTGFVGSVVVGDVGDGANLVLAGPAPTAKSAVKLTAGVIGSGTNITVAAPVKSLKLVAVPAGGGSTVTAPTIGSLIVTGAGRPGKAGYVAPDFRGEDVTVTGGLASARVPALGLLKVGGAVDHAVIKVASSTGSFGNVGAVAVGSFVDSELFAGYAGPADGSGAFNLPATVGSFTVKGKANAFARSSVVATNFGPVSLASVDPDNAGTKFGFVYHGLMKSLTVKSPAFQFDPKGPAEQDMAASDFCVRKV